nr:integrase, catalytic region, zinc finger, CCHC-type, peptidase aspartic, catalytic [Tanacetum cinerariifolium]
MTNNINYFKEIVDNAWVKHTKDQFRAPTARDMDILIKTCLMPLALKTQNDSFIFVHELKQEMHADLKYIESLEKEIDELESDKAEFSNMYDMILQEYLKAQLQDKNIAISELNKLIEKCKEKSMETKFDKPSVVRQPNSQRIPKSSILEGLSKTVIAQTLPQTARQAIVQLILFIVDSGCMKHMTGNLKLLCNFVEKYLGTVRFGNDQFAPILIYGDLVQGNIMINMVYYVECLNHNLFSVDQFCDADLKVAFRKSTCFVRDLQGNELLTGNSGSDLYTISLQELTSSTPLCLMAKASPTQAWKPLIKHLHIFVCICYLTRDDENLDKMKEKGDSCILVGYSTQSKEYRVYNKRTRLIVESIYIRFDEIKEMSETFVANDTSGLVPQ